jgi:RHS repeat-associated protein
LHKFTVKPPLQIQTLPVTTTYSLDLAAGLTQVLSDGTDTYLYGLGRIGGDGSGGWGHHLGDALGSLRQLVDGSGAITLTQPFEPFGAPLSNTGAESSEFGFTGEQDEVAGLVFLRARFYDPGSGRFISKDPFPGFPASPATLHPYLYVANNPVNLVDPSGQIAPILAALGIGGIIGGIIAGISHALSNPCQSLSDMLTSGEFWRDVGIGFVSGALAGLVGFAMPHLLPLIGINIQASLGAAIIGGAITGGLVSGAGQVVTNLLMGEEWHTGLGSAVIIGIFSGGIAGGVGFKLRQFFEASRLRNQLSAALSKSEGAPRITVIGKSKDGFQQLAEELGANALDIPTKAWERIVGEGGYVSGWNLNADFLDDAITRGDFFLLATPFEIGWAEINSPFKTELWYLLDKGYRLFNAIGYEWLVPGQ